MPPPPDLLPPQISAVGTSGRPRRVRTDERPFEPHQLARLVDGIAMEWGFGGGSQIIPFPVPLLHPLHCGFTPPPPMPTWPSPEGKTAITLELRTHLVIHLDTQARYEGCSRAAYIRGLIVRDMERQGPGRAAAKA